MAYVFHPLGCNGEIEPQVIKGFQVEVSLPFEGGSLNNFMASPATHRYLDEEWSRKLALFFRTTVTMAEKADNMKLDANKHFMEGMINNEKTSSQKSRVISVNLLCISGTFTRTSPWQASILWLNWRILKAGCRTGNTR